MRLPSAPEAATSWRAQVLEIVDPIDRDNRVAWSSDYLSTLECAEVNPAAAVPRNFLSAYREDLCIAYLAAAPEFQCSLDRCV
jgi:hypothetical protein